MIELTSTDPPSTFGAGGITWPTWRAGYAVGWPQPQLVFGGYKPKMAGFTVE